VKDVKPKRKQSDAEKMRPPTFEETLQYLDELWEEQDVSQQHRLLLGNILRCLPEGQNQEYAMAEITLTESGKSYAQKVEKNYRMRLKCSEKIRELNTKFVELGLRFVSGTKMENTVKLQFQI